MDKSINNTDISVQKVRGIPFKSGDEWNGNASGRPVGTYSLKRKIIELLKANPDKEEKLLADLLEKEQGLLIQMIDGRPKQDVEIAQKEIPQPIISLGNLTKDATGRVIDKSKDIPLLENT